MIVEITAYQPPGRLATTAQTSSMDIHSTLTFEPGGRRHKAATGL